MRMINNRWWLAVAVVAAVGGLGGKLFAADSPRHISLFNDNWKFSGMQAADMAGAQAPTFSDAQWRTLNVPHDWSIEGKPDINNPSGPAGAYMPGGFGYYRKSFPTPPNSAGKRVYLQFDGVMQDAVVWLNGEEVGRRPNGYATFRVDLTGKLKPSGDNLLAVKSDMSVQPASRWYAGGGIYRHVRLIVTDPVHVDHWATFVTTPRVEAGQATVHIETSVANKSDTQKNVSLQIDILGPNGQSVQTATVPAKPIAAGKAESYSTDLVVRNPQLWDVASPNLYKAVVRVQAGGNAPVDEDVSTFGIRTFEFKSDTGFWLNGKNMKMYGVCLHHDGGGMGAAVPNGIWERRLTLMREMGVNAIRTSHNIPDPEFLDLCDRMGFLVMHELYDVWEGRKVPGDYARFFKEWWERDLVDTLMRDRNHPSIVIHCAGNEIRDNPQRQKEILADMLKVYRKYDPTRPVTQGLFRPEQTAYVNGHAAMLDVVGTNYRPRELVAYHRANPGSKIIGTEDNYSAPELITLRDSPALAGEFLWTGIDYLGEGRTPPSIAQGFGMIDRTNEPKLRAFERQSWWTAKPMVKIGRAQPTGRNQNDTGGNRVIDWTPPTAPTPGREENVEVWSNAEEVELFLNDKSLGAKTRPANWSARNWQVAYAPGTLKAVAKNKGQVVATDELRSAGKATKVKLTIDQPKLSPAWDDVAYARVHLVDDNGVTNPNATDKVTFKIEGPGIIAAVDNADLDSHEAFRGNERSAFRGSCIAILKATGTSGKITLTASAPGMAPATVTLDAAPAPR